MALSSYDTLAVNEKGEPTNGVFVSPLGVEVCIYKTWLYVRDVVAWQEGGRYVSPIVMEIREGDIWYKDIHVVASRGPQSGVYAIVYNGYDETFRCMVGCGVYGWVYPPAQCGHNINEVGSVTSYIYGEDAKTTCFECGGYIAQAEWVGVTGECVERLRGVISGNDFGDDAIAAKLLESLGSALRFNQGDAFFAKAFGEEVPASEVGEGDEPILGQILNNIGGGDVSDKD